MMLYWHTGTLASWHARGNNRHMKKCASNLDMVASNPRQIDRSLSSSQGCRLIPHPRDRQTQDTRHGREREWERVVIVLIRDEC